MNRSSSSGPSRHAQFRGLVVSVDFPAEARESELLEAARVHEIAAWLPSHPAGGSQTATNRAAWSDVARQYPELQETINEDVPSQRQPIHVGSQLDHKITGGIIPLRLAPRTK